VCLSLLVFVLQIDREDLFVYILDLVRTYALPHSKVVETLGAEIRVRNLKDDFLLLAPKYSVYNHSKNDKQMEEIHNSLLTAGKINTALLEPLKKLERPEWMGL
jgi:hypothetical protein